MPPSCSCEIRPVIRSPSADEAAILTCLLRVNAGYTVQKYGESSSLQTNSPTLLASAAIPPSTTLNLTSPKNNSSFPLLPEPAERTANPAATLDTCCSLNFSAINSTL